MLNVQEIRNISSSICFVCNIKHTVVCYEQMEECFNLTNFILWKKLTIMRCRRIMMHSVFCAKMLTGSYDNSKIISITVRNFTWLQCFIINEHLNRFSLLSIYLIYLEKVLTVPLEFIWEGKFLFIYVGDKISLCSFSWPKTYLIDQADKELRDLLTDLQRVLGLKAYVHHST